MARHRLRRFFRHGFLPQLLAFEACVRLGSVTRAAEELALAQPTVSCMLRKLADSLGGPIIEVRDRRVQPTDLGRELLQLSRDLVLAFQRFDERHGPAPRYDAAPWPSSSPPASRSRWRQRASQCPRARRPPNPAAGES